MSHKSPFVSVIIPTYNRAEVIMRAINSVLNQTYKDFEMIIIDDGSSDNTEYVVKQIIDSRVRYIKHHKNLNGAIARNTGIDASRGEFIAFLDSDDEWLPRKLEKQLSILLKCDNKENVLCYSQLIKQTGAIKRTSPKRGIETSELVEEYLFLNNGLIQTSTLILHHSLIKKIRFDEQLIRHQDWDLCLRLSRENVDFLFLNEPLAVWYDEQWLERVSKKNDYKFSLKWINSYKGEISERAYDAFLEKTVIPRKTLHETNLKKKTKLKELMKDKKVAIYGAGLTTQSILEELELEQENIEQIVALIDSSPEKQGMRFQGIKVFPPSKILSLVIDVLVISVDKVEVSKGILTELKGMDMVVIDLNQYL
ncbi:glycosyltransferase family 2 protein [Alkalihalobacillus trypoxylicola]|uniref:Glycosyltransferase 2-like domain-containing protein n=1 Tax=Alkalihalobacillus trypoxylicola TaxID=519424 RepID=A0A161PJY3_9BACI|nr:glycosyltransferase family 2 protein [Alkalihalobacillus trypoxylicola]KYG33707.1 hypothetical protein AZF04_15900 [Alkalihalobacillus trypoxylicola]